MYQAEVIFEGSLIENALNYSSFFRNAEFIFIEWTEKPDWSQSGDFVEIDGDLLITVAPGVKRQVKLFTYLSTRDAIAIPAEYSQSGFLMELVLQSSFSVALKIYVVTPETPVNLPELAETVSAILNLLNGNVLPTLDLLSQEILELPGGSDLTQPSPLPYLP